MDALEPKMSKRTLEFHWGKHHRAYVDNLNNQVKGKDLESMSLEQVMHKSWNGGTPTPEFNNAGQVVNHTFFWELLGVHVTQRRRCQGKPQGRLLEAIERDFGSYDAFRDQFKTAGATQFGSGWAWLVVGKDGRLKVTKTPNAENPWVYNDTPILTIDVWEHAYYLDFQNRRPDFIDQLIDKLIPWDKVAERYAKATA